jgi:hypothetical protein
MPKGVEHGAASPDHHFRVGVPNSVMPKGVEHSVARELLK